MGVGAAVVRGKKREGVSIYEFILYYTGLMLVGISSIIYFFTKRSGGHDETSGNNDTH